MKVLSWEVAISIICIGLFIWYVYDAFSEGGVVQQAASEIANPFDQTTSDSSVTANALDPGLTGMWQSIAASVLGWFQ